MSRDAGTHELCSGDSFLVEIEGISEAGFARCSGLGARAEVFELLEGGATSPRRLRGATRFDNIVLERGVVLGDGLHAWFRRGDRRDGWIVLVSPAGRERLRWRFLRGWPCRWEGPSLDAEDASVAVELLEIAHEGIEWPER